MNKEVYKVPLGGIIVRLRNKANVCEEFLDAIFAKSELDNREMLLILDDKNGYDYGDNGLRLRGSTTPSCVFSPNNTQETVPCRHDIEIKDLQEVSQWVSVVDIPKITTDKWKDFKPYFAFVLGHELEHVKVILENVRFHMCATWLLKHNYDIFAEADIDCKLKKTWDFPLELHCNKKGKKLATDLFGKKEFDECFKALMKDENEEHKKYLAFVMEDLKGKPYAHSIWESICYDIRAYYYNDKLKKAAYEIWGKDKSDDNYYAKQFNLGDFLPLD